MIVAAAARDRRPAAGRAPTLPLTLATHPCNPQVTGKKPSAVRAGPPAVSVNHAATCGLTGEEPVYYKVGDNRPLIAERVNGGAFKIALPNNLPDVSGRGRGAVIGAFCLSPH